METEQSKPVSRVARNDTDFYPAYSVFAKTLRTWLIAYGVGAPLAFFQLPEAWDALGNGRELRPFVYLFLAGIGVQVVYALINKSAMWYLYMDELNEVHGDDFRVRISAYVSTAYWFEVVCDVATIACFGIATVRALRLVLV